MKKKSRGNPTCVAVSFLQSYEIKSPPWTILWFRIPGIFSVQNIKRLCIFMFQTWDNSQLLRRVLWISAELTIVSSLKHKNTRALYIFNRENPQNSEPQNGPRRGLDIIALVDTIVKLHFLRNLESNTVVLAMNTVYLCKRELPAWKKL